MSCRVIIRHSTGSKASTVEEATVHPGQELTFGRDTGCDIRFDQDRDEYVSRRHMKLVVGDPDRLDFTVVELSARNGTFVNRRRVQEPAPIKPGDVVQLGAGGPEFVFDFAREDLRETPVSGVAAPPPAENAPPAPSPAGRRPRPAARRRSPKKKGAGVLILVGLGGAAGLYAVRDVAVPAFERVRNAAMKVFASRPSAPQGSVATIEHRWRLLDQESGRAVRQIYLTNRQEGSGQPLAPGAGPELPVFVLREPNRLEPLLTLAEREPYRAIGGAATAAAFTVEENGPMLTSSVAAAPWDAPYAWPAHDSAGIVVVFDGDGKLGQTAVLARRQFPRWVAANAELVLGEGLRDDGANPQTRIRATAVSESLTAEGCAVKVARISQTDGVAAVEPSCRPGVAPFSIGEGEALRAGGPLGNPILDSNRRVVGIYTGNGVVPIRRALDSIRP